MGEAMGKDFLLTVIWQQRPQTLIWLCICKKISKSKRRNLEPSVCLLLLSLKGQFIRNIIRAVWFVELKDQNSIKCKAIV